MSGGERGEGGRGEGRRGERRGREEKIQKRTKRHKAYVVSQLVAMHIAVLTLVTAGRNPEGTAPAER